MAGSFQTDDAHGEDFAPVRAAILSENVFQEAQNLVHDLPGWTLVDVDDAGMVMSCQRKGGLISGASQIIIRCEGPAGLPSCTITVHSTSQGGLRSRDRANVAEFVRPFRRRVC